MHERDNWLVPLVTIGKNQEGMGLQVGSGLDLVKDLKEMLGKCLW